MSGSAVVSPRLSPQQYANKVCEALEEVVRAAKEANNNGVLVQFSFGQQGNDLVIAGFKAFQPMKLDN